MPSDRSKKCSRPASSSDCDISISQREELPGVDHKPKLGPRSLRHHRLDLTTDQGESRFLGSVKKELSKKSTVHKLQTAFQSSGPGTEVGCKTVHCTNQDIAINLSSPLDGISLPHYINKNQNKELVKDIPHKNLSGEEDGDEAVEGDGESAAKLAARPSVLAVNLKWKHGITLKQIHKYTTKTTQLEPLMRKTEFPYEGKTRFENQLESACEELFPEWQRKLMILDGNECHHQTSVASTSSSSGRRGNSATGLSTARSERLQQEGSASGPHQPDPYCREWREYKDLEEHKILVVPYHSRNGFEMDLSKRYQMPYQAKFVIGRRAYHHRFMLQLPVTKSPQHYGLIFTFSEDPKGHSKIRIKSLLSVYCLQPVSPKLACLETYEMDPESMDYEASPSSSPGSSPKKKPTGAAGRAAKNAMKLISDNLSEEKLVTGMCGTGYGMERGLAQPGEDCQRFRRLYRNDYYPEGLKQKKKNQIKKTIRMEQAKC